MTSNNQSSILPFAAGDGKREVRVTKIAILPKGEPLFSELTTHIEITDEAASEFLVISQEGGRQDIQKAICIDGGEWPLLRDSIEYMLSQCRDGRKAIEPNF